MTEASAERVVEIYTDGACSGNPGPGGWGAVLRHGTHERELHGGEPSETTNNRMELMAPIRALESLTRPATVLLHTDSTYVRDGITKWVARWKTNGWRTAGKQPVKNVDLWQRLQAAASRHQVQWHWVKGHAGHPDNERADRLAAKGLQEASLTAGKTAPPVHSVEPTPPPHTTVKDSAGQSKCRTLTSAGTQCPNTARPSSQLCHIHDPAVQCGMIKKNGQRCAIATGGGPCAAHNLVGEADQALF